MCHTFGVAENRKLWQTHKLQAHLRRHQAELGGIFLFFSAGLPAFL
jgi:hypothetical protein